jgi:hypothetical protein
MTQKSKVEDQPVGDEQPSVRSSADSQMAPQVSQREETSVGPQVKPVYPSWPTSKPGPRVKLPPPGMRSVNAFRPEQVSEIGYDQETGEPGIDSPLRSQPDAAEVPDASFDQRPVGQDSLHKGKKRL